MESCNFTSKKNYFIRRKGTPAPAVAVAQFQDHVNRAVDNASTLLCNSLDTVRPLKMLTNGYWKLAFESLADKGRFLACDKNLGVRFVSKEYYAKLADIERRNYEHNFHGITSASIIKNMLSMAGVIATVVHISAIAPNHLEKKTRFNRESDHDIAKRVIRSQLAVFIRESISLPFATYKLPFLRMTLKVHKPLKNGLIPTRPIIPTCGLPNFAYGQWLGKFLAKMARQIPWNLECTKDFQSWLAQPLRSKNVTTFDFSNLYGSEPVRQTLCLFASAIEEMPWKFEDKDDALIFESLRKIVAVPPDLGFEELIGSKTSILMLLLTEQIRCTIAELDLGDETIIVATDSFLAMGCPPVAPLSIISLGYLEFKAFGFDRCTAGMKRYIDDIALDTDIISELELRSIYPDYLTLNGAGNEHFLDVSFKWSHSNFETWPYIKEFATIPLSYLSAHPYHTIRAAAKNELNRLMSLTSMNACKSAWAEYWFNKYTLARYPKGVLKCILQEVINGTAHIREKSTRGINHVETWRGVKTCFSHDATLYTKRKISSAWKVDNSLLSIALKAHKSATKLPLVPHIPRGPRGSHY